MSIPTFGDPCAEFVKRLDNCQIHQAVPRPGRGHRDGFLACCLLLGFNPRMVIQRREVREIEIENPHIAVLDQGQIHDPALSCFDDHVPSPREHCSLSLILKARGVLEHAYHTWPWLAATEILDLHGLGAVNRAYNIPRGQLDGGGTWLAVASPLEKYLLDVFSRHTHLKTGHELHTLMKGIGQELVTELSASARHFEMLDQNSITALAGDKDPLRILWVELPATSLPERWLSGYCHRQPQYPDLVVIPARFGRGHFVQFRTQFRITPRQLAEAVGDGEACASGVRFSKITCEELQSRLSSLLGVDDLPSG